MPKVPSPSCALPCSRKLSRTSAARDERSRPLTMTKSPAMKTQTQKTIRHPQTPPPPLALADEAEPCEHARKPPAPAPTTKLTQTETTTYPTTAMACTKPARVRSDNQAKHNHSPRASLGCRWLHLSPHPSSCSPSHSRSLKRTPRREHHHHLLLPARSSLRV